MNEPRNIHAEIIAMLDRARAQATHEGKYLMLDAFCCGGGASKGYIDTGSFVVVGVDIADRSESYHKVSPYFWQGDAVEFIQAYGHLFDAVVGSPPCQASTALTKGTNKAKGWGKGTDADNGGWINLIPATREQFALLNEQGIPTVIENVQGSELRRDLTLCGTQFGLKVFRHRYFEVEGFYAPQPDHEKPGNGRQHFGRVAGWRHGVKHEGEYFAVYGKGGGKGSLSDWQNAMGIDWLTDLNELAEAIPPAYTTYIGHLIAVELDARREERGAH